MLRTRIIQANPANFSRTRYSSPTRTQGQVPMKVYTTTEILKLLKVQYWRLEHLIRAGKVRPQFRGRGRERRFSVTEFNKAKKLLSDDESTLP